MAANFPMTIIRGDVKTWKFTMQDRSVTDIVTPIDITGWTFTGTIKHNATTLLSLTINITDATSGKYELVINKTDSESLSTLGGDNKFARYEIEATTPAGPVTLMNGRFTVVGDIV